MAVGKGTLNKVMLIGRLGADPELKYTPSGAAVTTLRLATNLVWKDKDGNPQERTEWHRVVAWRKLAEIAGEWLKKGSQVYIEGRLRTRSWEDRDGVKKYITEVEAENLLMLGKKGAAEPEAAVVSAEPLEEVGPELPPPEEKEDLPF